MNMENDVISIDEIKMIYLVLKDDVNSDHDRRKLALTLLQIKASGEKFSDALKKIEDEKKVEEEKQAKWKSLSSSQSVTPLSYHHPEEEAYVMWGNMENNPFADYCYGD
jgi:hypothetical protein